MPELPEVETMRRGIRPVVGGVVTDLQRLPCPRKPIRLRPSVGRMRARCLGRRIEAVERVGKRVVLRLEGGDLLVFEPRMTGLVLIDDPPSREHLRLRVGIQGAAVSELLFWDRRGLGGVRLFRPSEFATALGGDALGPDALAIEAEQLRERLGGSRRAIKVALLDQKAVAGIGNLYASEILFHCGMHPATRCHRISRQRWRRLHAALQSVLQEAIRYEGSTLADGTYRTALNDPGGYQNHHRVYGRAGLPCYTCGEPVLRIVQAQRSTFFCPRCQRR